MVPATIRIGIATISLNPVVSRLRSRSGYSTENCTGYGIWRFDSIAAGPPRFRAARAHGDITHPGRTYGKEAGDVECRQGSGGKTPPESCNTDWAMEPE